LSGAQCISVSGTSMAELVALVREPDAERETGASTELAYCIWMLLPLN